MSSVNKRKGTQWESDVRDFLNRQLGKVDVNGRFHNPTDPYNVRRQAQEGTRDIGDVWAAPFVLECKNTKTVELPAYVRQAEAEAANAGLPYGVAVVKQRGKGPAHGHVVMSLATFARVIEHLRENSHEHLPTPGHTTRRQAVDG